jgi:RNA polymerase sigma-70 factor (ECF subfamily)
METTQPPTPESPSDTSALDRYRPELLAHCYRMMGSVHDAEDLVQETYLRAWRAQDSFEGRSSMRTWLYRIATNACLTALQSRGRRPMPTGLGQDASDPFATLVQQPEVPWLEPVPDALVSDLPDDPAAVVTSRESVRLAFVAALQHLPPRQRVVLVLRDVLAWRAAEVAELLGTSTPAVNSMLQRAHASLEQASLTREDVTEPDEPERRALLDRYVAAFEEYDVEAIVSMFTDDAVWEMPPFTGWYQGARTIGDLISSQCPASGPADMRMLRADANGQPAFALYMRDPVDGAHKAFQIQVLTLDEGKVSHVGCFFDTSLFRAFGLPETYPGGLPARSPAPAHSG